MKIGIIGSGTVGQALGLGFVQAGHEVMIGTRDKAKLADWEMKTGVNGRASTNDDAAKFGELLIVCTKWDGTENAIRLAGKENFKGKIVIYTTNPLHFNEPPQPPSMDLGFPHSSGKKIQEWLPESHVVKCFNSVTATYMCNPALSEGTPDMFVCGNDSNAKQKVMDLVQKFGWSANDVGDISQSYLLEALAMLWITYGFRNNHWTHAFKLLKK